MTLAQVGRQLTPYLRGGRERGEEEHGESQFESRSGAYLTLAVLAAVGMMLGVQGLSAVLPELQRQLGLHTSQIGWFTAVYMIPGVLLAIPLGIAADRLGRRVMFCSMMTLYGVAGVAQTLSEDYGVILALRFIQGIGFATIMPLTITLIGDVYRGLEQLRAQSTREVSMIGGELIIPLVGAMLAGISWRAPILAQGGVLPLAVVAMVVLRDRPADAANHSYGVGLRGSISQPGITSLLALGFARFFFKFAVVAYLPILLVNEESATIAQAAVILSIISAAGAVASLQTRNLMRIFRASTLFSIALAVVGVGLGVFGVLPSWIVAIVGAACVGAGDGMISVLQNGLLIQTAQAEVRAGVVGVSSATRNLGKFLAPLVMGGMVAFVSVQAAFVAMALIAVSMAPLGLGVRTLNHLFEGPGAPAPTGVTRFSERVE